MVWGFGENPQPGLFGVKNYTVDQKIKKVQAKKKIVKSNKFNSRKFFDQKISYLSAMYSFTFFL